MLVTFKADAILQASGTKLRPFTRLAPSFEVYEQLPGWQWDQMYWPNDDMKNTNATLPVIFDPANSSLPNDILQSGIGGRNDLKLLDIVDMMPSIDSWAPKVEHGTYFIYKDRFWLYSEESVAMLCGKQVDADGLSQVDLWFPPKNGIPILAAYLTYNTRGDIVYQTEFGKLAIFTGITDNGVEMDTVASTSNIDSSKNEFKVVSRPDYMVKAEILTPTVANLVATFTLKNAPLSLFPFRLTRPDIFKTEISYPTWVDRTRAGNLQVGDYYIGHADSNAPPGIIQVKLAAIDTDYGSIDYVKDYPASLVFNKNVVVSRTNANIGRGSGGPSQRVLLDRFPVYDESSPAHLDVGNFTLTIGGVPWTRVADFTGSNPIDTHFTLDAEYGVVMCGDAVNGAVFPENDLLATYEYVPFIEYEPSDSVDWFLDGTVSLDPTKNSLTRGFIYLSNRQLLADHMHLAAQHPVNQIINGQVHHGPIQGGAEIINMVASLHGLPHEPVPNEEVRFFAHPPGAGDWVVDRGKTDSEGKLRGQFLPGGDIDSLKSVVDFYLPEEDVDPDPVNLPAVDLDPLSNPVGSNEVVSLDPTAAPHNYVGAWNGTGAAWTKNTIIVPHLLPGTINNLIVFAVYNDDEVDPFLNETMNGGREQIFAYRNPVGSWSILRPVFKIVAGNTTKLVFDRELTTKDTSVRPNVMRTVLPNDADPNDPGYGVMQYRIIGDQTIQFSAQTVSAPIVSSQSVFFDIVARSVLQGQWIMPEADDNDASALSAATWIFLNSEMEVLRAEHAITGAAQGHLAGGYGVRIVGIRMPIDEELKPNVFVNGVVVDRAKTQLSANGTYIDITEMPAGAVPGQVEILVGYRRVDAGEPPTHTIFTYV